jgi:hypothetical protein
VTALACKRLAFSKASSSQQPPQLSAEDVVQEVKLGGRGGGGVGGRLVINNRSPPYMKLSYIRAFRRNLLNESVQKIPLNSVKSCFDKKILAMNCILQSRIFLRAGRRNFFLKLSAPPTQGCFMSSSPSQTQKETNALFVRNPTSTSVITFWRSVASPLSFVGQRPKTNTQTPRSYCI